MDYHLLLADRTVQIVRADNCSSAIGPALPYYCPSMDICNIGTSTIRGGRLKIAPCIFRTSHVHVGRIRVTHG